MRRKQNVKEGYVEIYIGQENIFKNTKRNKLI
jgi:hypothetical protein